MNSVIKTDRDDEGKYTHKLERICRCGRTKGQHLAVKPYPCDADGIDGEPDGLPECEGFKVVRAKRGSK